MLVNSERDDPRSQQKQVGPSGLGNPCWHCLGCMLAELPKQETNEYAWAKIKGHALHGFMADLIDKQPGNDYLTEHRVTVGDVGDKTITGSADLFDIPEGVVVDWKFLGTKSMSKVARGVIKPEYLVQPNLYGLGFENEGYRVTSTLLMFIPVDSPKLADAVPCHRPYDRGTAEKAMHHANNIWNLIQRDGVNHVIPRLKRDPECWDCTKYGL